MVELVVGQARKHVLDDDTDERLRMQGAARDEIVQEMADSAAELLIGLDELNRALVLGPQDCEQL